MLNNLEDSEDENNNGALNKDNMDISDDMNNNNSNKISESIFLKILLIIIIWMLKIMFFKIRIQIINLY